VNLKFLNCTGDGFEGNVEYREEGCGHFREECDITMTYVLVEALIGLALGCGGEIRLLTKTGAFYFCNKMRFRR
jgi:hypothetical protein